MCSAGCLACLQCKPSKQDDAEQRAAKESGKSVTSCTFDEVSAGPIQETRLHLDSQDSAQQYTASLAQETRCAPQHFLLLLVCVHISCAHDFAMHESVMRTDGPQSTASVHLYELHALCQVLLAHELSA